MRIHFVRSGGFAGMRVEAKVDTDSLPPEEALALQNEIKSANFFELPTDIRHAPGGADRFQYEITVDDGAAIHTVTAGESSLPDSLRPLVQHLDQLARTSR